MTTVHTYLSEFRNSETCSRKELIMEEGSAFLMSSYLALPPLQLHRQAVPANQLKKV
jgi:hypothetical protein